MLRALVFATLLLSASGASALTLSWSANPTTSITNPTASLVSLNSGNGSIYYENVTGSVVNRRTTPWSGSLAATGLYSAISRGTVTYSLGASTALSFLWSSPDNNNTVRFLRNGQVVDTLVMGGTNSPLRVGYSASTALATIANIAGGVFDQVQFSYNNISFEFAHITRTAYVPPPAPVPLPAGGLLLGGMLAALGVVRRRR